MKKKIVALTLSMMMVSSMLYGCGDSSERGQESTDNTEQSTEEASSEEGSSEESSEGNMAVPDEITLYTYYADSSVAIVDETLNRMKELYPDLTINIEHRTDSDGSVLKTRAAVGELPDIFECTGQLTDILYESGDLAPLDDAIEEKDLFSYFLDGNFDIKQAEDGHYYAIDSTAPQACLVFYNTEVFDNLGLTEPTNYDEFKEVVQTLVDNDIIPLALFAQQKWPGLQMFDMAVVGEGQSLGLTGLEDGSTKITDPEYLAAAQKIEELVSMGLIGKGALNTNASQAFEQVGTGQAGMLINGSWFFDDAIAGGWADHIDYFEYNPFADAGKEEDVKWHMSGGTGSIGGYAVSAKGEYAEFCKGVAVDFVHQRAIVSAEMGTISALKDAPDPTEARPVSYQDFADHVGDIKSTTKFEWSLNNQELIVALEDTSELLTTGSYSAQDFIDELDVLISEALGE